MPYLCIWTQINIETGPTYVGDSEIDERLVTWLGGHPVKELGRSYKQYACNYPIRIVLDKLESAGYEVVGMTGLGQTLVFSLKIAARNYATLAQKFSSL